jgi:hypothetical protein
MLSLLLLLLPAAHAAPAGWVVVPFGVGVYVHHRPVRGVAYTVTQAAGIATAAWATKVGYDAAVAEDDVTFGHAQAYSLAGVTLAAASYLVSVLDASRLHELEGADESARRTLGEWDHARVSAVATPAAPPREFDPGAARLGYARGSTFPLATGEPR